MNQKTVEHSCDGKPILPIKSKTLIQPTSDDNPIVFLDIQIGKEFCGRMVIELRSDVVPKTAENFRALCTGECGNGQFGKPLHYKGIRFHKVVGVFAAQCGDVVNNDGTSGESIYGPLFEDENFELKHEEGVVSMANYGKPHTNNSQFFITSVPCENLNGTNVVVGRVLRGFGIIGDMEQQTTDEGQPKEEIVIVNSGEIKKGMDWGHADKDETKDTLPPYPSDWEEQNHSFTSDQMVDILTGIRNAGNEYFAQKRFHEARRKYRKANRYYLLLRNTYNWQELENYKDDNLYDLKKIDNFSVINNVNMAASELKLNEYANAKYLCSEALRLDPANSKAYYRRAQAQIGLRNYEEAIEDFQKALDLKPDNKQILNELNKVKKMRSDYNQSQMAALKKYFK